MDTQRTEFIILMVLVPILVLQLFIPYINMNNIQKFQDTIDTLQHSIDILSEKELMLEAQERYLEEKEHTIETNLESHLRREKYEFNR